MKILSIAVLLTILAGVASANFISAAEQIDINSAALEDLIKIIHIGEARAKELISLRPFSSLDDLVRIKGVGSSRVDDIKKQGLAWVLEEPKNNNSLAPVENKLDEPEPYKIEKGLAAAGEQLPQESSYPLLIAMVLAVFSAIIILLLKNKLKTG